MIKKNLGSRIFDVSNYLFMFILIFIFAYPLWETLVLSLSEGIQADTIGLKLFPWPVNLEIYRGIFKSKVVYIGYYNTLFRTVIGTSLSVIVTYFGAYALSRREMPFRTFLTIFILLTMFFSGGLIPTYMNIKWLGLMGSRWVLILPMLTSAWHLILCRNFIMTLPKELEDAARMDGAHPVAMILLIMLPLSTPILAVLALWVAITHWNAWFDCLLYIMDKDKMVLQLMLQRMILWVEQGVNDLGLPENTAYIPRTIKSAYIMVTIGPIILLYPFLQKYFIKGIFIGSLKG